MKLFNFLVGVVIGLVGSVGGLLLAVSAIEALPALSREKTIDYSTVQLKVSAGPVRASYVQPAYGYRFVQNGCAPDLQAFWVTQ